MHVHVVQVKTLTILSTLRHEGDICSAITALQQLDQTVLDEVLASIANRGHALQSTGARRTCGVVGSLAVFGGRSPASAMRSSIRAARVACASCVRTSTLVNHGLNSNSAVIILWPLILLSACRCSGVHAIHLHSPA